MKSLIQSEFKEIGLEDMLSQLGEDMTKDILSSFMCPQNEDVQKFLKEKAILFSQKEISKTYLVFWEAKESKFGKGQKELVGYYAIGHKPIKIPRETPLGRMTSSKWREICRIANERSSSTECILSSHMIGQLGKNYCNANNHLISGKDLLQMALQKIVEIRKLAGGKVVFLECEDEEKIQAPLSRGKFFYSANNSFPRPAVYLAPAAKPFSSVSAIKSFSNSSAVK